MSLENAEFKQNKEKGRDILRPLVYFGLTSLLAVSPVVGENLIATKDNLSCRLGENQRVLEVKNPTREQRELLEVFCLALDQFPELRNVEVNVGNFGQAIGEYSPETNSIRINIQNIRETGRKLLVKHPEFAKILANKIGKDLDFFLKNPEYLAYGMVIHELGHAKFKQIIDQDIEYYRQKYPDYVAKNPDFSTFIGKKAYISEMFKYIYPVPGEKPKVPAGVAYRKLPQEEFSDNVAANVFRVYFGTEVNNSDITTESVRNMVRGVLENPNN